MPAFCFLFVLCNVYIYSSIAQSVEHAAVNRRVVGSSPTGGARKSLQIGFANSFFVCSIDFLNVQLFPQRYSVFPTCLQRVKCFLPCVDGNMGGYLEVINDFFCIWNPPPCW